MNFIKNLFFPSVDSIMGSMSTTVARLNKHAVRQRASAAILNEVADQCHDRAMWRTAQADRADRAAERVRAFLA